MKNVYQRIWDADQATNGLKPILDTEPADDASGYVKVSTGLENASEDHRVLPEVEIPSRKRTTFDLCRKLFDNYALRERDEEFTTAQEREEIHELVQAMIETPAMDTAREYVSRETGTSVSRERWYTTVMEMWFRTFSMGGDPHLTGFEHVIVGEQEKGKAQGYHFWYKYYLDDGFARNPNLADRGTFVNLANDRIVYLGSRQSGTQSQFPESVTISYRWHAPDYDRGEFRPLTKPTGGFFVGCSVEGLLAMGTVRAHRGVQAPKQATINGANYTLKMFTSHNGRHVRTFYPMFKGPVKPGGQGPSNGPVDNANDSTGNGAGDIRIIAALINPEGHDPGKESVTLFNRSPLPISINGWSLVDKNGRETRINGEIPDGEARRFNLDGYGTQLSNSGGELRLQDQSKKTVHFVTYSRSQAKAQGRSVIF